MRITAYIHPKRTAIAPTGVGKHIIHMVRLLSEQPGIDLHLLVSRAELVDGKLDARSPLRDLPTRSHPLSRSVMEKCWLVTGHPLADRWAGHCDWIYCPAEAFVPTRRAKLAVTVHDTHPFERDLPWSNTSSQIQLRKNWEMLFKRIGRHAQLILAVSQFTKSRLIHLFGWDPARIAVVGNGVDHGYFAAPDGDAPGGPRIDGPYLYVSAGLSLKKGGSYLLAVARRLKEMEPDMRIVAAGAAESPFDQDARQIGNILQPGYVPVEQQVSLMRGAVALLMLSRFEGFGVPALESMAVGTPAIVSGFASLPEIVGDAGVVVDAEQPEAVIAAIRKLMSDSGYRNQIVAHGRQRAAQFHWSAACQRLVAALNAAGGRSVT